MRLIYGLLVGSALLSGGCFSVSPTVKAISGRDSVPLGTREEVHEALGMPTGVGTVKDIPFEEYQVQGGCEQTILGFRVPAFQPLEEFHVRGWGDLQLIEVRNVSEVPTKGKNLIVVATVGDVLHFRIFDEEGNAVVQTDETKLTKLTTPTTPTTPTKTPAQAAALIADLKNQLQNVRPLHKLTEKEKKRIITAVASIVGHVTVGSFELGVTVVRGTMWVSPYVFNPAEADRHRVVPGQTLRFDYDKLGNVTKVYLDGKSLFDPHQPLNATAIPAVNPLIPREQ